MMFFGKATDSSPSVTPNTMRVVVVPVAVGGGHECRVVEGRDAAGRVARLGVAEWAVVDEHATPADPPPIDVGVGVGEERCPSLFDEPEELALESSIVGWRRGVPCDQMVGGDVPGRACGLGVVGDVDAGEGASNPSIATSTAFSSRRKRTRSVSNQAWRASPASTNSSRSRTSNAPVGIVARISSNRAVASSFGPSGASGASG